jgi:CRISPR system Cascade subunit CasC
MSTFIQLHILTSYPASNLNRDDMGRPKTVNMGRAQRLRVSSQSLKRAWRTSDAFEAALHGALGTRTKELGERVFRALTQGVTFQEAMDDPAATGELSTLKEKPASEIAKAIAAVFGKLKSAKEAEQEAKDETAEELTPDAKAEKETIKRQAFLRQMHIEQLAHVAPPELAAVGELVEQLRKTGKTPSGEDLDLLRRDTNAADIAMFGRMLAAAKRYNIDAAVQVAHAFTVHPAGVEDDFFTAVDDLNKDEPGAAHMGVFEYGAGLYYLYVCINRDLLVENLSGDRELADKALRALAEAALKVSPTGKQNSFASRANASYCLAERSEEQPRSLSVAFLDGVREKDGNGLVADAVKQLVSTRDKMNRVYGLDLDAVEMDADAGRGSAAELLDFVTGE